jgi:hypothetical protein
LEDNLTLNGFQNYDMLQVNGTDKKLDRIPIGSEFQIMTIGNVSNSFWNSLQSIINDGYPTLTFNNITVSGNLLLPGSNGDIYQLQGNILTRVPIGSAGQALVVNTSGNGVQWQTLSPSNSYISGCLNATIPFPSQSPGVLTFGPHYQTNSFNGFSNNGSQLTYIGATTKVFAITAVISVLTQQDNTQYYFYTRLNGSEVSGARAYAESNKQTTNATSNTMVSINPGSSIDFALALTNPTSGVDLNIFELDFTIQQVN